MAFICIILWQILCGFRAPVKLLQIYIHLLCGLLRDSFFFRDGKINVRQHGEHKQINVGCFIRLRITETRSSKSTSSLKVILGTYNGFMTTTSKIMTIFVRILRPSLRVPMFCKWAYDLLIAFNPCNALDFFVL